MTNVALQSALARKISQTLIVRFDGTEVYGTVSDVREDHITLREDKTFADLRKVYVYRIQLSAITAIIEEVS